MKSMLLYFALQLAARDDVIQRLNAEVGKLRTVSKDKLSESQRQSDMLKRLQEALTKSQVQLDETRRKSDNDVSHTRFCFFDFIKKHSVAIHFGFVILLSRTGKCNGD